MEKISSRGRNFMSNFTNLKTNGGNNIVTIDLVKTQILEDKIKCPNPDCGGTNYLSYNELYEDEWISLQCECLNCHSLFQINYRAVSIDMIKHEGKSVLPT